MQRAFKQALTTTNVRPLNDSGAVAVYVALIAVVILGMVGLAIDASRAMVVHSEAQAAADAASLAGGSQLDGTPTAITRATNAINTLVSNNQRLASTGAGAVSIAQVRFLSSLPASDDTAITAGNVTIDPLKARFVEVTTGSLSHQNTFLTAVGADADASVATRSVAGGRQMVCRSTPMMICNPAETPGNTGAGFDISQWRGRQIRFITQDNGQWAAGNFGWLASGGSGANALRDALAQTTGANICYGPTVETEPGLTNGARTALNVRFGMYENPGFGGNNNKTDPLLAPDVNVRTMPRDTVFSGANNRFGNGVWNCLDYWNNNFASSGAIKPAACTASTSAASFSRYQMNQFEIANNLVDVVGAGGVSGRPPFNAANALADRRLIYVAVINCVEEGLNGRDTVPVIQFLRVFLTEPVTMPSGVEVVGEILDVVQVGVDDTVLHEIVQIYR